MLRNTVTGYFSFLTISKRNFSQVGRTKYLFLMQKIYSWHFRHQGDRIRGISVEIIAEELLYQPPRRSCGEGNEKNSMEGTLVKAEDSILQRSITAGRRGKFSNPLRSSVGNMLARHNIFFAEIGLRDCVGQGVHRVNQVRDPRRFSASTGTIRDPSKSWK